MKNGQSNFYLRCVCPISSIFHLYMYDSDGWLYLMIQDWLQKSTVRESPKWAGKNLLAQLKDGFKCMLLGCVYVSLTYRGIVNLAKYAKTSQKKEDQGSLLLPE